MLVLTRRIGEIIIIGDGDDKVEITILGIRDGQVRLGIKARKEISVHRKEIFEKIHAKKDKQD